MIYLTPASGARVREAIEDGLLGQLVGYRGGDSLVPGATWALDNDCFNATWRPEPWLAALDRYHPDDGCLFATVPDVVGDARRTDERWERWAPSVIARGYPAAYVAQNGCVSVPELADVLFIGGDTTFKLGPAATALARQARERGLPVHMGRVNSRKRLRYAQRLGCRSVDGTRIAVAPTENLAQALAWLTTDREERIT